MAVIGEKELRAQLKSGTLSHAYFIYGDEGYLKDHYIGQIKKKAVDPAFADFNIHIYEKDAAVRCAPRCRYFPYDGRQ